VSDYLRLPGIGQLVLEVRYALKNLLPHQGREEDCGQAEQQGDPVAAGHTQQEKLTN
jgi:hypothetical protein